MNSKTEGFGRGPRPAGAGVRVLGHQRFLGEPADEQAGRRAEGADGERHTPAPFAHGLVRQAGHQQGHRADRGEVAERRADVQEAGEESTAALRCGFHQERRGGGKFAAGGQPLQEPGQHQDDGREHPDLVVGGGDGHQEAADAHQHHGRGERLLPAETVRNHAAEKTAQRTHEEADGEDRHGAEQRDDGVARLGEELGGKVQGQHGVDVPVEPFNDVSDGGGRQLAGPADRWCGGDDAHPVAPRSDGPGRSMVRRPDGQVAGQQIIRL